MPAPVPPPLRLSDHDRMVLSTAAAVAVGEAAERFPAPGQGQRKFRLAVATTLRAAKAHGASHEVNAAARHAIDTLEPLALGAVDAAVDAGVAAVEDAADCPCDARFIALVRGFAEMAVEAVVAGARSGLRV